MDGEGRQIYMDHPKEKPGISTDTFVIN